MRQRRGDADPRWLTSRRPVPEVWVGSLVPEVPRTGHHLQTRGEVHPEGQTRLVSLVEAVVNVGSGFLISLLLWQFVLAPWFGYEVTLSTNLQLTSVFTAVSVARGYLWRRFFERKLHRLLLRRRGSLPSAAGERR